MIITFHRTLTYRAPNQGSSGRGWAILDAAFIIITKTFGLKATPLCLTPCVKPISAGVLRRDVYVRNVDEKRVLRKWALIETCRGMDE